MNFNINVNKHTQEYIKCALDCEYFILNYVKIPHPMRGKIPFALYPFQSKVLKYLTSPDDNVLLKPRQMGITTLLLAYVLWKAMFHPHSNILYVTIKAAYAKSSMRKMMFMYENLPDFLKLDIVNGTRANEGTQLQKIFSNGSIITAAAATGDVGRSEALTEFVGDEFAFWRSATEIWASLYPTLSTGGKYVLSSTAFGTMNEFYNMYISSRNALTSGHLFTKKTNALRLYWRMHPERDIDWYNSQRKNLGEKRTAQEIDCDFLTSGYNVFDIAIIRYLEDKLSDMTPISYRNGTILEYYQPVAGERYFLGADIATGRSRDFSAFSIYNREGKEYACAKMKTGISEFTNLIEEWGYKYNIAKLAPEITGYGEGVVSELVNNRNYPNMFYAEEPIIRQYEYENRAKDIAGWFTTGGSRNKVIAKLSDDLSNDLIDLNNPFFNEEASTFIYDAYNRPVASGKDSSNEEGGGTIFTDDSIFAEAITNYVRSLRSENIAIAPTTA